jgi:hypothetical protein
MTANSQNPWLLPGHPNDDEGTLPSSFLPRPTIDDARRGAAKDLNQVVGDLGPTPDAWKRRGLHEIRLAAEALRAVRPPSMVRWRR